MYYITKKIGSKNKKKTKNICRGSSLAYDKGIFTEDQALDPPQRGLCRGSGLEPSAKIIYKKIKNLAQKLVAKKNLPRAYQLDLDKA